MSAGKAGAWVILSLMGLATVCGADDKALDKLSPIDRYILEAGARASTKPASTGSLYTPGSLFGDLSRDLRASRVDDIVTIIVADRASAVSRGTTSTARQSSAKTSVGALFGPVNAGGALANLADLGGKQDLQGQGETSRETALTTTVSARVTHVLPNGFLVVEGIKDVFVNSEHQRISVRGVVRWSDIDADNQVSSERLADLEVRFNGRGVVGDALRRPNFLYRLVLGLLPF